MEPIQRTAFATWKGGLESGAGAVSTESKALQNEGFAFKRRVTAESPGTNPEELLAAAAAACFSMALSKTLEDRGHTAEELNVIAELCLEVRDEGPKITELKLTAEGEVPGMDENDFRTAVESTRESCPVYQLLAAGLEQTSVEAILDGEL
ncbi:MAG: OsmC family peroxiredoxin [Verrucomicrobiota bacterium]